MMHLYDLSTNGQGKISNMFDFNTPPPSKQSSKHPQIGNVPTILKVDVSYIHCICLHV